MTRRLLRWFAFAAFCAAVGAGVFGYVRYQPCCVIRDVGDVLHLSPDGATLIARPLSGATGLQRWHTRTGRVEHVFLQDVDTHKWLGGDVSGDLIAVAPGDGTVRVADWRRDVEFAVHVGEGQTVSRLQFSPHGRWLLARLPWQALDCYIDVPGRRVVQRREDSFVAFSADEDFVVVRNHQDWDEPVDVVSLGSGKLHGRGPTPLSHMAMAPAGALLAVGEVRRESPSSLVLEVWDVRAPARCFAHQEPASHFRRMRFSADGKLLAVEFTKPREHPLESTDWTTVFDTATGKIVASGPESIQMIETSAGTLLVLHGSEEFSVLDVTGQRVWARSDVKAFWIGRNTTVCRPRGAGGTGTLPEPQSDSLTTDV